MIRSITEGLQRSLLEQPESGMGYQVVEAEYRDGRREQLLALNASYLARDWREVREAAGSVPALFERSLKLAAGEATLAGAPEIRSLHVVKTASVVREARHPGPASSAPETETATGDEFRRFSAFENDLRITPDKGLLPGTYATTAEDGDKVKTGEQAVRRYALPNPTPACHEFVIRPPGKTIVRQGVVQPAYGQPGGGVEVIFVAGSPPKTVTGGRALPPR